MPRGGVAIHCRTDRRIKEIRLDGNQYECLWDKLATSYREYHIASLYHPPTFEYSVTDFIDFLANFCESILPVTPNARIVIAGDVNQLVVKCLIEQSPQTLDQFLKKLTPPVWTNLDLYQSLT